MIVPHVIVRATMRTGAAISVDNSGYNSGTILAQTETPPINLARQFTQGASYDAVGGTDVYGFTLPMAVPANTTIEAVPSFNIRVDTMLWYDNCPAGGYVTPNFLLLHTDKDHRPRLQLGVVNNLLQVCHDMD